MFRVNPFGTPLFKSMMIHLESHYHSYLYGYCNGDLLFHSSFIATLNRIVQLIKKKELLPKVFFNSFYFYD